jgi:hypothetical protein
VATKAVAAKQAIIDLDNMAPPPSRRLYWKNGPSFAVVNRTRRLLSSSAKPNGRALAYVYFEEEPGRRAAAKLLTPKGREKADDPATRSM